MVKTKAVFRAPTSYEEEMMRAKRQQQLAEALRQQAFVQDEEPFTFQGFRAMPSPAGALSRVLQAYAAKKVGEKAEQAETRAREADVAEFEALRRDLGPQTQVTGPDMFADPMEMASKYTPPVTQTVMLTPEEREERLVQAMATGGPRAQRYAELMLSREPKEAKSPYGSIDPSKFTRSSLQAFDESVRTGKPNYTLLDAREYAELTPQQQIDAMFRTGEFGIKGGQFTFETGQAAPQLRFPFQSQITAPPAVSAAPAAAPQARAPAVAAALPTTAPVVPPATPRVAAPAARTPATGEKPKPPPVIQTATPQQRLVLQQELPKARMAAQVGLGKLDQLDAYLADLENHAGLDRIAGKLNQYEFTDVDPSALSARSVFNGFLQGTSIQSINEARQSSTSGGAFGNMTVQEWPRLEGAFGAVVAAKNPDDLRRAIRNARAQINASRNRYTSSWEGMYGDMDIGYAPPSYEPESLAYPKAKPKQSESRSIADRILEDERKRARGGR